MGRATRHIRAVGLAAVLGALITTGGLLSARNNALSDPAPTAGPAPTRYAVVLVVDGTRYDQFDLARMPNLSSLIAHGAAYAQASVGQLPSVTESSHATIGTGVVPARHGVLGDSWHEPGASTMTPSLLDANLIRTGYLEKMMRQEQVPSLAGIIHGQYKGSIVVSLSGHKTYAASAMSAGQADYVAFGVSGPKGSFVPGGIPGQTADKSILSLPSLHLSSYPRKPGLEDSWATDLGIAMLKRYHPRVMMINYPEPDDAGHAAGPDPKVIEPIMLSFDRDLGRLIAAYRAAGILSQTDFVVTSDHGMVPATYTVSSSSIENVIKKAGAVPLYVGHGDTSMIWLKQPTARQTVAAALAKANIPHVIAAYVKTAAGTYQWVPGPGKIRVPAVKQTYADLLQTISRPESPDIVLLYDENTITMTTLFRQVGRKGDHQGATWGSQHVRLIMSGPGIRSGYSSTYPAHLVDIAPTVETLLRASPAGQDGIVLADAMTGPDPSTAAVQAQQGTRRLQDVTALQQEAALAIKAQRAAR